jgi:uncharacterized damage-inducible protein DinB
MIPLIEMLFEHNFAHRPTLLDSIENLTQEEFTRDLGVGRESVRNILIHVINAEYYWFSILTESNQIRLDRNEFTTVSQIREVWTDTERKFREVVRNLTEKQLQHVRNVRWGDQTVFFTVAKALVHLAMHEVHHRGLIVGLLRQLGQKPPYVGMI